MVNLRSFAKIISLYYHDANLKTPRMGSLVLPSKIKAKLHTRFINIFLFDIGVIRWVWLSDF